MRAFRTERDRVRAQFGVAADDPVDGDGARPGLERAVDPPGVGHPDGAATGLDVARDVSGDLDGAAGHLDVTLDDSRLGDADVPARGREVAVDGAADDDGAGEGLQVVVDRLVFVDDDGAAASRLGRRDRGKGSEQCDEDEQRERCASHLLEPSPGDPIKSRAQFPALKVCSVLGHGRVVGVEQVVGRGRFVLGFGPGLTLPVW